MAAPNLPWISTEEFLALEEASETKHMYFAGTVTVMAGGSIEHARLAMNLAIELGAALRGRDCCILGSDVLFQTGSKDMLVYPDLMVFCGPVARMPGRTNVVTNPIFLVEVLSPGTEARDRGEKAREYRASPALRQYVFISQDSPRLEIHTRGENGTWLLTDVSGLDSEVEFASLECKFPMAALYRGVLAD